MSWLKKYKLINKANKLTVPQNIMIDNQDTLIPKNLPTFIIGPKGIGKSTLISTILNGSSAEQTFERIFYVYVDHVDSTIAETCKASLIRIPLQDAPQLLEDYFRIKTKYISYMKLLDKVKDEFPKTIKELMEKYTDNVIDETVRQYNGNVKDILQACYNFVMRYSSPFTLNDNVRVAGLGTEQYDMVVIDDVAVAADYLFPTNVNKSPIYSYLTISRHIMTGFIIAGQDTMQLPRYARKEINTWVFFKVLEEDLKNITVKASIRDQLKRLGKNLKEHSFIVYNGVTDKVTVMEL